MTQEESLQEIESAKKENRKAILCDADLYNAILSGADLSGANLRDANLGYANLHNADLGYANLHNANLGYANLHNANLHNANLGYANLRGANLSQCKGLLNSADWMGANFERTAEGYIVYKTFGMFNTSPSSWKIEAGGIVEEIVNSDRAIECGSGVNFATLPWIEKNNQEKRLPVWKCLLRWEDLLNTIVPYHTDGKARCGRLQLLEIVK